MKNPQRVFTPSAAIRVLLRSATLAVLSLASVTYAQSEGRGWPAKPVKILVPFALGGATDIVARILAPGLSEVLGQQIIVENRPGAAGNIAVELAAKAAPDGYTVLIGNISTNAINPTAFAGTLKVDPTKELIPVTLLASIPNVLVSGAAFPPPDFKALIEYVRARPGELNYSNPLGSYSHLDTLDLAAR